MYAKEQYVEDIKGSQLINHLMINFLYIKISYPIPSKYYSLK